MMQWPAQKISLGGREGEREGSFSKNVEIFADLFLSAEKF